jgi:hypothetical protein
MWLWIVSSALAAQVHLADGEIVEAREVTFVDGGVRIGLCGEGVRYVALAHVVSISEGGSCAPASSRPAGASTGDPTRSRYFYSPSAFSLGAGHGYFSQKEIAFSELSLGLTDFWDVQVGTVLPTLFIEEAAVGIAGTKLSLKLHDKVRVAAGGQVLGVSATPPVGFVFGGVTLGSEEANTTLMGGVAADTGPYGETIPTFVLSGKKPAGEHLAVVTENWVIVDDMFERGVQIVPSGGVRYHARTFSADLGVIAVVSFVDNVFMPLPWLDVTWHFDLAKG